ncbi:MAG TPA: aminoglycoside adenylyltransferase domain-containing protein [Chloroflexota bacterium]
MTSETSLAQHWSNCDPDIHDFLLRVASDCKAMLAKKFVAVYLHGSLAMGSFRRNSSDLDVLCITNDEVGPDQKVTWTEGLLHLSDQRPTHGDIEVSVVRNTHLRPFVHPTPYQVHYSAALRPAIESGKCDFSRALFDRDLAAHCRVLRARGVVLEGPPIHSVIGEVSRDAYVDSLLYNLADILNGTRLIDAPVYGILNCCRILAALDSNGPGVLNKEEGGVWGLAHMPRQHRILVGQALEAQRGRWLVAPRHRMTGGLTWNREAIDSFRDYVVGETGRLLGTRIAG